MAADHLLHNYAVVSKFVKHHTSHKALLLLRLVLCVSFFKYRISHCCLQHTDGYCLAALACEALLAMFWLVSSSSRLFPVERETHPETLSMRCKSGLSLPAVDVFVTTADPFKEPPLITMNTILSVLAVDYPAHKIACYVSDDGGSLLTLSALSETSKFARKWVPFCKKSKIEPRAPAAYFSRKTSNSLQELRDGRFEKEWEDMKKECEDFKQRIDMVMENCSAGPVKLLDGGAANDSRNHPGVFQILLDKDEDANGDPLPCLTYISREKRRDCKHHYKAGAMNALVSHSLSIMYVVVLVCCLTDVFLTSFGSCCLQTRVSGIMTNAPCLLNLDCDMYINDSKAILHSMCFLMDPYTNKQTGFVQFPQCFEGVDEEDLYGNRLSSLMDIHLKGMDGAQGPPYCGTACVHKGGALYGQKPDAIGTFPTPDTNGKDLVHKTWTPYEYAVKDKFGRSSSLSSSVQNILGSCSNLYTRSPRRESVVEEAIDLISCTYEDGTQWGKEIGWMYGSTTEDVLTGLKLHSRGWKSIFCTPSRPAFQGCAITNSHDALTTRKRWNLGMLEILFGRNSPMLTKHTPGLTFLQRVIYIGSFAMPLASFPIFAYGALPALCLFNQKSVLPKISDPAFLTPLCLFIIIYGTGYMENVLIDVGAKQWWNSERMEAIVSVSSHLFAVFEVILKITGISDTAFVVTPKDQKSSVDEEEAAAAGFVLNNSSALFIPPTVLVILNAAGVIVGVGRAAASGGGWDELEGGELFGGVWVIFVLLPFFTGLYKRGDLGLPTSTILKSSFIALLILALSRLLSLVPWVTEKDEVASIQERHFYAPYKRGIATL